MTATIHHGDCLDVLRAMPDNSVHAIVTDPPYGLSNTTPEQVADTIVRWVSGERDYLPKSRGFMGAEWDGFVPPVAVWDEAMRVLKPGGHVLAFAGTRTMDLMTLGLRLAGFDIRDSVAWLYGSGFPKSMDIGKAIDKLNGRKFEDRYALGRHIRAQRETAGLTRGEVNSWFGYKDGCEHWERQDPSGARVPTLADWHVLKPRLNLSDEFHGLVERVEAEREVTGKSKWTNSANHFTPGEDHTKRVSLDITAPATDAAKQWHGWGSATKPAFEPVIMARKPFRGTLAANVLEHGTGGLNIDATRIGTDDRLSIGSGRINLAGGRGGVTGGEQHPSGRWPANVILDEHMAGVLDQQSGPLHTQNPATRYRASDPAWSPSGTPRGTRGEVTQATGGDHEKGLGASKFFYVAKASQKERPDVDGIKHPTVKPLALMKYLVRLVTPPNGIVLDPFAGSGTTIEAAMLEGFQVIGIEREAEYLPLIRHRIDRAAEQLRTEQQQQAEAPDQGAFPLEDIA